MNGRVLSLLRGVTVLAIALASSAARADDGSPEPPAAEPHDAATKPASPVRFGALLSGGVSYRSLYSFPIESWDMGLGAGAELGQHVAVYARGTYEQGRTPAGLSAQFFQLGASLEGVFGRFRPGIGVDGLNYFAVRRISSGAWIDRFGVGVFASLALDLLRVDGHALYVGARFDADFFPPVVPPTPLLGTQGCLGVRW